MPFVYILRCADNTLYVGHTTDLASREDCHNRGVAVAYTAARRPVRIVYSETHDSLEAAVRRERQLKRWSAQKKEALIADDVLALKALSRRRRPSRKRR